jgi:hypothetical protein
MLHASGASLFRRVFAADGDIYHCSGAQVEKMPRQGCGGTGVRSKPRALVGGSNQAKVVGGNTRIGTVLTEPRRLHDRLVEMLWEIKVTYVIINIFASPIFANSPADSRLPQLFLSNGILKQSFCQ